MSTNRELNLALQRKQSCVFNFDFDMFSFFTCRLHVIPAEVRFK